MALAEPHLSLSRPACNRRKRFWYRRYVKRGVDLGLVLLSLPVALPVIGLCLFLVRLDGGLGFFGHRRVGQGGQMITVWKLRTMVSDADTVLAKHLQANPQARADWVQKRKLDDDPRVTRLGQWLRKFSLDELPQLWNVWRGEMSIVGPRPVTEDELAYYGHCQSAYLEHRPGITGLWQVFGREDGGYAQRVALDTAYAGQLRLWTDLGLILLTLACVLVPTGR
ncbi:MAG: sugar transferase [Rhodobacteraceae bacterium]|nr:sugar transferase [Paracoccaceae bacterium]